MISAIRWDPSITGSDVATSERDAVGVRTTLPRLFLDEPAEENEKRNILRDVVHSIHHFRVIFQRKLPNKIGRLSARCLHSALSVIHHAESWPAGNLYHPVSVSGRGYGGQLLMVTHIKRTCQPIFLYRNLITARHN